MGLIIERQKRAIIEAYYSRLQAFNIDLDEDSLIAKFNNTSLNDLRKQLLNIIKGKQSDIIKSLKTFHIQCKDKTVALNSLKEEVKKSLNLSSIVEFSDSHRDYFKFKEASGDIILVRNLGNDSKALFTAILNNSKNINSTDGQKNALDIFKSLKDKKFIEIPLDNSTNINTDKFSKVQVSIVREIEKQFPNKQVVANISEGIYIVKGGIDDDIVLSVTKKDGKYKVSPLTQKTYGVKPDENTKNNVNTKAEIPNDMIIELESNEEIAKIIEDGLNMNLSDEQISENTISIINTKYSKFKNIPTLGAIIMMLIQIRKEKRTNSSQSKGGRQYIFTDGNTHHSDSEAA